MLPERVEGKFFDDFTLKILHVFLGLVFSSFDIDLLDNYVLFLK